MASNEFESNHHLTKRIFMYLSIKKLGQKKKSGQYVKGHVQNIKK